MKHHTFTDISRWEKRFKASFINSLTGCKSANLIGTINHQKKTNLAIFSSAVHLGADPPLMALVSRPNTVPRDTLSNIHETGCFTVNHVHKDIVPQAHMTSARTEQSEFDITGLKEHYIQDFLAPFVKESLLKIGLEWVRTIDLTENGTHLIIGKIMHVLLPESALLSTGDIDLVALQSMAVTGLNTYHPIEKGQYFPYAKSR